MIKRSKQLKKFFGFTAALLLATACYAGGLLYASTAHRVSAQPQNSNIDQTQQVICKAGEKLSPDHPCIPADTPKCAAGQAPTDANPCTPSGDPAVKTCSGGDCSGLIKSYVNPFIRLLAAIVAIVVTISVVVAGVQYSSAGGDPSKVAAAKKRIYNSLLALLAYLFMFAFLQWLLPGGIV